MSVRNFGSIKTLLHFDYPYIHEPGDGMLDEVSNWAYVFSHDTDAVLAGQSTAADIDTPLFGYRCIKFKNKNAFLKSSDNDLIRLLLSRYFEIEFCAKFSTSASEDTLFAISQTLNSNDYLFVLTKKNDLLYVNNDPSGLNLPVGQWINFRIQVNGNVGKIWVISQTSKNSFDFNLDAWNNIALILIGGYVGLLDELVVRNSLTGDPAFPEKPYHAVLDVNEIGGFGNSLLGDVTINSDCIINSYGLIKSGSNTTFVCDSITKGAYGGFEIGDEVMIHVTKKKAQDEYYLGKYAFRKIINVQASTYTLDSPINDFSLSYCAENYYVQAIKIPNFKTLTLNQNSTISPLVYDTRNYIGGIVAFRVKGNFTVNGNIITSGKGPVRDDFWQMTHGALIDRFLINKGGGIFITVGDTITTSASARIGASWDGSLTAGLGKIKARGTNAGAGYGGGGGGDDDSNTAGGNGGVGGGGGGHDSSPGYNYSSGGNAGENDTTGGYGFSGGKIETSFYGGTQGVHAGAAGNNYRSGGGALGNGGLNTASAGACLILVANNLNVLKSAVSTGGEGGLNRSYNPVGGGGTGMCYIAGNIFAQGDNYVSNNDSIRYSVDTFNEAKSGVLISNPGSEIDFSAVSSVPSVNLYYEKPGNSEIYIAFKIANSWCKVNQNGTLLSISENNPDFDTLKNSANTPETLRQVQNFNIFSGKKIGVAIGLFSDDIDNSKPKIRLSFNTANSSQSLTRSELSSIYTFDTPILINNIDVSKSEQLGGTVDVTARAVLEDNTSIDYSDVMTLYGKKVKELQFKGFFKVPAIETAYSKINEVKCVYSTGNAITSGVTLGEIISVTQNWYMNLSQVRMNIRHAKLRQSSITAYAAFRNEPVYVTGEVLGSGSGGRKTFVLQNSTGLKYDTLKLYYDGVRVFSGFEFNTEAGRITCNAPLGVIVSCDYQYKWENEIWQEMTLHNRYDLDDYENSEFRLAISDENKKVCAVKVNLQMNEGNTYSENLGKGTGNIQTYVLKHKVKNGNIKIYANGSILASKNWYLMDDPQYVRIAANSGVNLTASYDWISETPEVYQIAAVFS